MRKSAARYARKAAETNPRKSQDQRAIPSEWSGVSYSPDGTWLFVHLQYPGETFAITGPWERGWL